MIARLPLNNKKMNVARKEGDTIQKAIREINQRLETLNSNSENQNLKDIIKSLINYSQHTEYCFLVFPNLRKDYRRVILSSVNIYPEMKEDGLSSIYRIMDLKSNYYFIK